MKKIYVNFFIIFWMITVQKHPVKICTLPSKFLYEYFNFLEMISGIWFLLGTYFIFRRSSPLKSAFGPESDCSRKG